MYTRVRRELYWIRIWNHLRAHPAGSLVEEAIYIRPLKKVEDLVFVSATIAVSKAGQSGLQEESKSAGFPLGAVDRLKKYDENPALLLSDFFNPSRQ